MYHEIHCFISFKHDNWGLNCNEYVSTLINGHLRQYLNEPQTPKSFKDLSNGPVCEKRLLNVAFVCGIHPYCVRGSSSCVIHTGMYIGTLCYVLAASEARRSQDTDVNKWDLMMDTRDKRQAPAKKGCIPIVSVSFMVFLLTLTLLKLCLQSWGQINSILITGINNCRNKAFHSVIRLKIMSVCVIGFFLMCGRMLAWWRAFFTYLFRVY